MLRGAFGSSAAYYVGGGVDQPNFALMAPESSRKARALAVRPTLRAYSRGGYQAIVERHVGLVRRVAQRVDEADGLGRLGDVQFNVVYFRYNPAGVPEDELDALNRRLGEAVVAEGRVFVGTTTYGGRIAFRPAIVNYRSAEADVHLLVDVIRELGASLHGGGASRVAASGGAGRYAPAGSGVRYADSGGKGKRKRVLLDSRTPSWHTTRCSTRRLTDSGLPTRAPGVVAVRSART